MWRLNNNQVPVTALLLTMCISMAAFGAASSGDTTIVEDPHSGIGLTGRYFDGTNVFTGTPLLTRIDTTVDFYWGLARPDTVVPEDYFSVRWSGMVEAVYDEMYTFSTFSDDGIKLIVNGEVLIDQVVDQVSTEWSGSITLQAGKKYTIELYYMEIRSIAECHLSWSSASTPKQIIPTSQLYSEKDNNHSGGFPTSIAWTKLSDRSFDLYPVPVESFLSVQLPVHAQNAYFIQVIDLMGKELIHFSAPFQNGLAKLDISYLPTGSYLVKVGDLQKLFYKK